MRAFILFSILMSCAGLAEAQLSSAGTTSQSQDMIVTWSVSAVPVQVYQQSGTGTQARPFSARDQPVEPTLTEEAVRIYPNPVSEKLTLTLPEAGAWQMRIMDQAGREVLVYPIDTREPELSYDVRSLKSGTYLITLTQGDHWTSLRFIKH